MASNKDNKNKLPENSGVNAKPIVTFLVVLTVATVFVYVIIKVMLWGFDKVDTMTAPPPITQIESGQRKFPAEPRLQGAPEPDANNKDGKASLLPLEEMADYSKKIAAQEASYGWVKGKDGVEAHISIDEAKKIIVERGLPMKSEALVKEIADAEKVGKQLGNADANAGRSIGK